MYLLDTNVVSEPRKVADGRADLTVATWASKIEPAACYLSVVTLMELELAIRRIERRDSAQARWLLTWMERNVLAEFQHRTFAIDVATPVAALGCTSPTLGPSATPSLQQPHSITGLRLLPATSPTSTTLASMS